MPQSSFKEEVLQSVTNVMTEKLFNEIQSLRSDVAKLRASVAEDKSDTRAENHANTKIMGIISSISEDLANLAKVVGGFSSRLDRLELANKENRRPNRSSESELSGVPPKDEHAETQPKAHVDTHKEIPSNRGQFKQGWRSDSNTVYTRFKSKVAEMRSAHYCDSAEFLPEQTLVRLFINGAPQNMALAIDRSVERTMGSWKGVNKTTVSATGSPSFVKTLRAALEYGLKKNSEWLSAHEMALYCKNKYGISVGTVWGLLGPLVNLGVISARDRDWVKQEDGGPAICGEYSISPYFIECMRSPKGTDKTA